ncbi:hypothetical protein [Bacillus badius]|uniref:RecT family protein n=1 Tax=Bacillus badius TaxID=1455 RepID=A0ABR5AP20_BACBA|nr:hypothetical protein [Bacillus badius]KIL73723.1 hypothetical protein SD77_3000 [Bacillus badius]MED4715261.1 hypothetical protein [Bacillus badius]
MAEQQNQYSTALTKISNTFFPMIETQLTGNGLNMDQYSKQCVMSAISSINSVLDSKGVSWQDQQLDKSNVTQTLLTVAALKLNSAANPREVYFQMRNSKKKVDGKDVWVKQIEMGIEGDGNDAILSNFGRGVKEVHQYWLVRSEDKFEYPTYRGIEMEPPMWQPTGRGEVVRVVYPITKDSGQVEYYIAEREDVVKNLIAHINNNLMNETFGIAKSRFDATAAQKKQIDSKKQEILKRVKELGLKALDDEELQQYISPAWKDPQSRESMIIRKMRNNIVKKIPKNFGNAFVEMTYSEAEDESYSRIRKEVNENANQEMLDIDTGSPNEESPETEIIDPEPTINKQPEETLKKNEQVIIDAAGTEGPGF